MYRAATRRPNRGWARHTDGLASAGRVRHVRWAARACGPPAPRNERAAAHTGGVEAGCVHRLCAAGRAHRLRTFAGAGTLRSRHLDATSGDEGRSAGAGRAIGYAGFAARRSQGTRPDDAPGSAMTSDRPTRRSIACPACGRRVGLWAGMKAATPFAVRCPHCRTVLRVQWRGLLPLIAGVVVGAASCAWSLLQVHARFGLAWSALAAVLWIAVWLCVEVAAGVTLYTHATFVPMQRARRRQNERAL